MNTTSEYSLTTPLLPKGSTSSSHQKRHTKGEPKPPTFEPLTKECRMEALLYVKACEREERIFQNFEQKVIEAMYVDPDDEYNRYFGDAFVEMVIKEVLWKNLSLSYSSWNLIHRQVHNKFVRRNRVEAEKLWGKTTKYHALIYRDFINRELQKAGITRSFPKC